MFPVPFRDIMPRANLGVKQVLPTYKHGTCGRPRATNSKPKGVPGEIAASPTFRRGEGKRGHP